MFKAKSAITINSRKPILITGCSSGIGLCVAKGLKEQNFPVIATARKGEDVANLQEQGFPALQLDLDDERSIEQAVEQALSITGGHLYALFNNGAYGQAGAVEDLPTQALKAQFQTNLFGVHHLTRCVLPTFRQQGYGRIIQNSSVLGFVAMPFRGAYNSSKFALEGLSDTLRQELSGTGIHVSLIEPGPVVSRFRENSKKMFYRYIDIENSFYITAYERMQRRYERDGHRDPFTLPPESVLEKVFHILHSPKPKARYYVTTPTYILAAFKRLLSTRVMDKVLIKCT